MQLPEEVHELCRLCTEQASGVNMGNVRQFVAGVDRTVPLLDGRQMPYVNLDNAATTPPFITVLNCLDRFSHWYSSVHRGTGFKSRLSTYIYECCREVVAEFVGADLTHHTVIFVHNATHALNKLANRLGLTRGDLVICTLMEHHSNMLPWRRDGREALYARVRPSDGSLDLSDLEAKIRRNASRLRMVTVTGASNVTGNMPPIRRIARLAHEHGAWFAVDATQLVPHRPFSMGAPDDPERVDFVAFSAHKMYAPFGAGVLVGPKAFFEDGEPDIVGGGTIHAVTLDNVYWASGPERDEAGTPNVTGALALTIAIRTLQSIGMENAAEQERQLTQRLLSRLRGIDGLELYGEREVSLRRDRIGVVPFNLRGMGHARLAAVLAYEWGIGVRNGCFCAQPYVRKLLGVSDAEMRQVLERLSHGDHATVPGMVRASIGLYNTPDEVDYLAEALRAVATHGSSARYVLDPKYMQYVPEQPVFGFEKGASS